MDVFLTLEKKLPMIVSKFPEMPITNLLHRTEVLRPLELLEMLKIEKPDAVPIEHGRFIPVIELMFPQQTADSLFRSEFPGAFHNE